jgi:hypothetical protein
VDITDLGMLATNWQAGSSFADAVAGFGLANAGVPEPGSAAIVVLALATRQLLTARRTRRRRRR